MGNNIDNRIVQLQFDNKDFEKAVSTTIASLDKLSKALELQSATQGFAGVTDAAQKVDLSSISAGVSSISPAFAALSTIAITTLSRITNFAIDSGLKIGRALTIEGMQAGFREYELKMGAIQVMMSSTGESLEVVNKHLQELNAYSDLTIYSFSDMTQNIGKFTNAGVKLPEAVNAIKGIANAAALSGANADEASRAMYNFGQAISAGYVKLVDWKSIELANMATVEFKTQLLNAGVAAGTLEKTADGMYKVLTKNNMGGTMDETISATSRFNESLDQQWMTSTVLTSTLNNYADATTDIGARASKAATEVKTFTQMMSTIREAIQSQWAMSAEYIFGDKNESLELWTSISNAIQGVINPLSEARNAMLMFWNDNGGRAAIIDGLTVALKNIGAILRPIGDSFKRLFPPITGEQLVAFSNKFSELMRKLTPSQDTIVKITDIFRGLFSILALLGKTFKFVGDVIGYFLKAIFVSTGLISGFGDGLLGALSSFFKFFSYLNATESLSNTFGAALANIRSAFRKMSEAIKPFIDEFKELVSGFSIATDKLKPIKVAFDDFINTIRGSKDATKDTADGISNVAGSAEKAIAFFSKITETISKVTTTILDKLAPVFKVIKDALGNISFDNILDGLVALAGSSALLSLGGLFSSVSKMFKGFQKGFAGFIQINTTITTTIDAFGGALKGLETNLKSKSLLNIAIAVAVLAGSMLLISMISPDKLQAAMLSMSILLTEVMGIMYSFSKLGGGTKGIMEAAAALVVLGLALIIMSTAVIMLGNMDPDELGQGLLAIGALLSAMGLFATYVKTDKGMAAAGAGMILFGVAMLIFAAALRTIGSMDPGNLVNAMLAIGGLFAFVYAINKLIKPKDLAVVALNMVILSAAIMVMAGALKVLATISVEDLAKSLLAMALGLVIMVGVMELIPDNAAAKAAGLLIMAGAIYVLGLALQLIASIDDEALLVALVGIGVSLVMIAGFLTLLQDPKILLGAFALVIVSGALLMLGIALQTMGSLSWEDIGKGLLILAGALLIIGIAGYALTGALPGLLGLGLALLLIGGAVFLAAIGIAMLALGLGVLATALSSGTDVMLENAKKLAEALPDLARSLAEAIGAFAIGLSDQAGAFYTSIITLATTVLDALSGILPKIFAFLSTLIDGVIVLLVDKIPAINQAMLQILLGLLMTIQMYLPAIIEVAGNLMVSFINGMSAYYDKIIEAGTNFIINLIQGIAENLYRLITAAMDTILKFINGLAEAIKFYGPQISAAAGNLLNTFAYELGRFAGSMDFASVGRQIINGVIAGIKGTASYKKLSGPIKDVVDSALGLFESHSGIQSPAKLFMPIGKYWVLGIAEGLKKTTAGLGETAKDVVTSTYDAMKSVGNQALDIFTNVPDPTIKPVVDLDNVYSAAQSISSLMNSKSAVNVTGEVGARFNAISADSSAKTPNAPSGFSEVTFNQTNNSPKSLSRLEIYRQTNNQLLQLKGLGAAT